MEGSAGGRYKNLGGPALMDLDQLARLVNHHCIESGKFWGGHGPPGPPGSAGPALVKIKKKSVNIYSVLSVLKDHFTELQYHQGTNV